jgi:hypothetical protein
MDFSHTFAGGWLGTYAYKGRLSIQRPVRFEATITMDDEGAFKGELLDDNYLLESDVVGEQAGRSVRFTKVYRTPPRRSVTAPVEYSGTMSEDGLTIKGTWSAKFANVVGEGVWDARRMWSSESRPEEVVEVIAKSRELLEVGAR